jgi:glutamyl-tRNA reductase
VRLTRVIGRSIRSELSTSLYLSGSCYARLVIATRTLNDTAKLTYAVQAEVDELRRLMSKTNRYEDSYDDYQDY